MTEMGSAKNKLKLLADRSGYELGGERVAGFADRPDLAEGERLKLARWAAQLRPEELSDAQSDLLAAAPPRRPSERRRVGMEQDRILGSEFVTALWEALSRESQELAMNPDKKLGEGRRYPLSTGDLHELTGLSVRQIQHSTERGLIPHWSDSRGHRRFEAAGAVLAFSMAEAKQPERQFLASVATAEAPLTEMRKAVGLISLYALSTTQGRTPRELEATKSQLRMVSDALDTALANPGWTALQ